MNKIVVMGVLIFVLLSFSVVAETETDSCVGFLGFLNCLWWGDPTLRENIVGEAMDG